MGYPIFSCTTNLIATMAETEVKYFTPREAQRTLPLVKKIVKDILDTSFQIRTIAESIGGNLEEDPTISQLVIEMDDYINELEELGCYYRDWNFSIGLVDFPSIIGNKEVYLCWRSDEPEITYYHGVNEGFAGRKLIPREYLD